MPTFADALRQLQSLQNESKTWTSGPLQLVVATSLSDDTPKVIDFSKTVGHNKSRPKEGKRDDSTCYFLPQQYNKNDLSERIIFMVYLLECAMLLDLRCRLNIKRK